MLGQEEVVQVVLAREAEKAGYASVRTAHGTRFNCPFNLLALPRAFQNAARHGPMPRSQSTAF